MEPRCACHPQVPGVHRRTFLADLGMGFTGLVLGAMLQRDGSPAPRPRGVVAARRQAPPQAQSEERHLALHERGVSHLETFDPKPMVNKYAGKSIVETPFKDTQDPEKLKLARVVVVNDANGQPRNKLYPLQVGFRSAGRAHRRLRLVSPTWASASTTSPSSAPCTPPTTTTGRRAVPLGRHMLDGEFRRWAPGSTTAWAPSMTTCRSSFDGQPRVLERQGRPLPRPEHDGVPIRVDPSNPLDYGRPAKNLTAKEQKVGFDLVGKLNNLRAIEYPDDPALKARIKAYELAFRMQTSSHRRSSSRTKQRRQGDCTVSTTRPRGPSACSFWRRGGSSSARALHPDPARAGGAGAWTRTAR